MIAPNNDELTDQNYRQKSFHYDGNKIFDSELLILLFTGQQQLIRAKGHVRTITGWILFNYTLSGSSFEPCENKTQSELVIITGPSNSDLDESIKYGIEKTIISITPINL